MKTMAMELVAGLGVDELVLRLSGAMRLRDCGSRAMAFWLWEMQDRRLSQALGYPDAVSYAVQVLGCGRRRAQELVAVGRALMELKAVDAAFRGGELNWSKVRMLTRVATVETERAWIARARAVTCRELAGLVQRGTPGEEPGDGEGGLPAVRFRLVLELDAVQFETWSKAKRKAQGECGAALTDADMLVLAAQRELSTRPDGSVPGREPLDESIYKVVVDPERAHVRADDGDEGAPRAAIEAATSDAAVSPALRRKVLARDGHSCRRCARRGYLQIHHVQWLNRGGRTRLDNLLTLCARCHALVHEGLLTVEGRVGEDLVIRARDGADAAPHIGGLTMALDVPAAPPQARSALLPATSPAEAPELARAPKRVVANTRDPDLTLETIPAEVSGKWWLAHQDCFVWRRDGTARFVPPRGRAHR